MTWLATARTLALGVVLAAAPTLSALAGEPVQDFTLRDVNGQKVTLSEYKGKVVLLSFWATWCGPCKVEMIHLQELYSELQKEGEPFEILSISSDDARQASLAKRYVKQKRFDFTVLLDPESTVTGTYNPQKTLPYGVLIGKDHTITKRYTGYNPGDEVQLRADVMQALGHGDAAGAESASPAE
jgi:peroxiredoxin